MHMGLFNNHTTKTQAHNEFMSKFDEKKSKEEKERKVKDAQRKKEAWARSNSDMKVKKQKRGTGGREGV